MAVGDRDVVACADGQGPVRGEGELEPLLVDQGVVPLAQQDQVGQVGAPTVPPEADVMGVKATAPGAAGEAAALTVDALQQRAQGRGDKTAAASSVERTGRDGSGAQDALDGGGREQLLIGCPGPAAGRVDLQLDGDGWQAGGPREEPQRPVEICRARGRQPRRCSLL